MAFVFDETTRKSISRRIVKIPTENLALGQALTNMQLAADAYTAVDDGNKVFFDNYMGISAEYEAEQQALAGVLAMTFAEGDLVDAVNQVPGNLFFPTTAPYNFYLTPLVADAVNGLPATQASDWEWDGTNGVLDYPADLTAPTGNGIAQIIDILTNGFAFGGASTTLSVGYTPGDTQLQVVNAAVFSVGQYLYLSSAGDSALFVVLAIDTAPAPDVIDVYAICEASGGIALGNTIINNFTAFSQAERQSLVAVGAPRQHILDGLTLSGVNSLDQRMTDWGTLLDTQTASLSANDDLRATPVAQIVAAQASITTAKSVVNAWQALADTGVGGKFDDVPLADILSGIGVRKPDCVSRSAEIVVNLGTVIDGGDGTYSAADTTSIYYERFRFVDARINRAFGSLNRALTSTRGAGIITDQQNNNTSLLSEYTMAMKATLLSQDGDGTVHLNVDDVSDFSAGDNIFIVDEATPETTATIQNISGGVITLNIAVPVDYTIDNLARILRIV